MVNKCAIGATIVASAIIATFSSTTMVSADSVKLRSAEKAVKDIPPLKFEGRRWTDADGCEYSRAGRPGETVWYLIINSSGGKKCRRVIALDTYQDNAYSTVKS